MNMSFLDIILYVPNAQAFRRRTPEKKKTCELEACRSWKFSRIRSILIPATTELVLELLDTARRIDETLFARVNRVRIHGDVADYFHVLNPIDRFSLSRLNSREGQELLSGRYVYERGRVVIWMNALFHGL